MQSRRLLVVDDNAEIGSFVRNVAEPLGYAVEAFTDAAGFEAALTRSDPDVVILDLAMPDTDGIELLRRLAERRCRARIFIMSGFDPAHQRMAKALGESQGLLMAGVIRKPVRVADLRSMLA